MKIKKKKDQIIIIDDYILDCRIIFDFWRDKVNIYQSSGDLEAEEKFEEINESVELDLQDFIAAMEEVIQEAKERMK